MAAEAFAQVPTVSPTEAQKRLQHDPNTLVIDVRDAADIAITGTIPGAMNISPGSLTYRAEFCRLVSGFGWGCDLFADQEEITISGCATRVIWT